MKRPQLSSVKSAKNARKVSIKAANNLSFLLWTLKGGKRRLFIYAKCLFSLFFPYFSGGTKLEMWHGEVCQPQLLVVTLTRTEQQTLAGRWHENRWSTKLNAKRPAEQHTEQLSRNSQLLHTESRRRSSNCTNIEGG